MIIKYGKIIVFVAFCFMSAAFLACSDDFITTACHTDKITFTEKLAQVNSFSVHKRYRDSVFLGVVANWSVANEMLETQGKEDQIAFPKFSSPELSQNNPEYLSHTAEYVKDFFLSWDTVKGAKGYEVRANKRPINSKNWFTSEKVMLIEMKRRDEKVEARARITPTPKIYTSSCIDCGECYKSCPTGAISSRDKRAYINYSKCINCGKCYQSCEYNAIGGVFAGTAYYFAIRAYDEDSAFSKDLTCTETRSMIRYTSLAELPDSLLKIDTEKKIAIKMGVGCAGNCTDGSSGESKGTAGSCHILKHNTCPVNAVYEVPSEEVEKRNTTSGAMFIDHDKCINCGRCVIACYEHGPWGAIITEVIPVK